MRAAQYVEATAEKMKQMQMNEAAARDAVELNAAELHSATSNFAATSEVGRGAYGAVYTAALLPALQDVGAVAIKRLFNCSADGLEEMKREVAILRMCHSRHTLPLRGYCIDASARCLCLVSPLCRGGNLEDRLFDTSAGRERLRKLGFERPAPIVTWRERLRILRDATRGLSYLHVPITGGKPLVLHRDVKPQNRACHL